MSDFLAMGGYANFIWSAYAVSALGIGVATAWTLLAWRSAKVRLQALEKAAPEKKP